MSTDGSVTAWIAGLKAGEPQAAQSIWSRYYGRLMGLARKKLRRPGRVADEEDAALEALASLFQRTRAGRFPKLHDRDDLWHLLVTITDRKTLTQQRNLGRQKRGGGRIRGHSVLIDINDSQQTPTMDALPGPDPTPEFAVTMAGVVDSLFGCLDPELAEIARLKLEGYTNEEIAEKIHRALATVERRLQRIRAVWQQATV